MKAVFIAILRRVLGAVTGFLAAGVIGFVVMVLAMVVTGSTFGLRTIRVPVVAAAILGALAGGFIPRVNRALLDPWFNIFDAI